jgi:hypothetical protein
MLQTHVIFSKGVLIVGCKQVTVKASLLLAFRDLKRLFHSLIFKNIFYFLTLNFLGNDSLPRIQNENMHSGPACRQRQVWGAYKPP